MVSERLGWTSVRWQLFWRWAAARVTARATNATSAGVSRAPASSASVPAPVGPTTGKSLGRGMRGGANAAAPQASASSAVRGVVVNMKNVHWMAYRRVDGQIWELDSRYPPRPVTYDEYLATILPYDSRAYPVAVRPAADAVG